MDVVVSTRHGEISDRVRASVEKQFGRLSRYESRLSRMEVTLNEEKNRWEVEALAHVDGAEPVHAHAEGGDVQGVVDEASDKMERQLRRLRGRHVDRKGREPGGGVAG
jgi:ribosomal subunit interface protein